MDVYCFLAILLLIYLHLGGLPGPCGPCMVARLIRPGCFASFFGLLYTLDPSLICQLDGLDYLLCILLQTIGNLSLLNLKQSNVTYFLIGRILLIQFDNLPGYGEYFVTNNPITYFLIRRLFKSSECLDCRFWTTPHSQLESKCRVSIVVIQRQPLF